MGSKGILVVLALASGRLLAQTPCNNIPVYTPCDFVFELEGQDAAAHPQPYVSVELRAEFRSPTFKTYLMPAFWDGGQRMVIRFTPTEVGAWVYRVTSNITVFNGKTAEFTAAASDASPFIRPANVHHWTYTEDRRPHLWMGDTSLRFAFLDQAGFERMADTRAAQKFNHLRGLAVGWQEDAAKIIPAPDRVDPAYFQRLDQRMLYLNRKGIIVDLILAADRNHLAELLPNWKDRERYVRYLVARYAPMNITWQGVLAFEDYEDGRPLMKEVGQALKKFDPYGHPRTSGNRATSAPLREDGWMDFISYQSSDSQLGSVEHQLYPEPFVNLGFGNEGDQGVDSDAFRHRLWNATMDGQYVTYGHAATAGWRGTTFDPSALDAPGAKQMAFWYQFFADTRHWELEPYFDVDGGRALALEDVEYIVYVEKPSGPVELLVEKHGYDVAWINPATGEQIKLKDFKGERFTGEPPDRTHDWVLHVSREGHKEGMLKSYKFESRRIVLQEIETNPAKVPYEVEQPSQGTLAAGKSIIFGAKIKRETHAMRSVMWLWTGEVAADGQGYRVLATGQKGSFQVPPGVAKNFPAVLNLRLHGMNAVGKVYSLDKTYQLTK